jgi:hypothetical protein
MKEARQIRKTMHDVISEFAQRHGYEIAERTSMGHTLVLPGGEEAFISYFPGSMAFKLETAPDDSTLYVKIEVPEGSYQDCFNDFKVQIQERLCRIIPTEGYGVVFRRNKDDSCVVVQCF